MAKKRKTQTAVRVTAEPTSGSSSILLIALIGFGLFMMMGQQKGCTMPFPLPIPGPVNPDPVTPVTPVDPIPAPSAALQALVQPLADALKVNKPKAEKIRDLYLGMAFVAEKDGGKLLKSTEVLSFWQGSTLDLQAATDPPMVGAMIDAAIAGHLGIGKTAEGFESKALAAQDVTKLAEVFRAIAWACAQAAAS